MAWIEAAGIPAVGIACRGFVSTTEMVARYEGISAPRVVEYPPPNVAVQNAAQVDDYAEKLADEIITALTVQTRQASPATAVAGGLGRAGEVVFRGTLDEVNDRFIEKVWTDGLPVMPPTRAAVDSMLRFTDRDPGEILGVLPPRRLAATVMSVAVNGVMAGCRPECLPVLIALVEAIAEPRFGLEHAGSTVGWTPLIVLNGPIAQALGFHSGQGLLRPQHRANATVSRFLRLAMMNLAGFRVGETDLATFGRNYYPVIAESPESPWPPMSTDLGFAPGANVVTVQSADTISHSFLSEGDAKEHLRLIAKELARELGGSMLVPMEHFGREVSPLIGLTPLVAGILAAAGFSRADVKRHLFEHALIPAREFDERLRRHEPGLDLHEAVRRGNLDVRWAESRDPERLVPVVRAPQDIQLVVCGSSNRNRSFIAAQFGHQGLRVSQEVICPPR